MYACDRNDLHRGFQEALESFSKWRARMFHGAEPTIMLGGEVEASLSRIAGLAWNCRDIIPGDCLDVFDEPVMNTYAGAARRLKLELASAHRFKTRNAV